MDSVAKDMQMAIPTPTMEIDSIGEIIAPIDRQPIVIKIGEETLATKVIDLINERTRLSGQNSILV